MDYATLADGAWTLVAFLHHLPLVLLVGLVAVLAAGAVGEGLGIPLLVWHEVPWKRVLSGASLTLVVGQLAFVGFLLDRDAVKVIDHGRVGVERYVATIMVAAALAVALLLVKARRNPLHGRGAAQRGAFPVGVLAGSVGIVGLLLVRDAAFLAPCQKDVSDLLVASAHGIGAEPRIDVALDDVASVLVVMLVLGFCAGWLDGWLHEGTPRFVTPVVSVCTLLGLVGSIYGFVGFHLSSRLPVEVIAVAVTAALLIVGGWSRRKQAYNELGPGDLAARPLKADLIPWTAPLSARATGPKRPLAVICTTGGASRAGVSSGSAGPGSSRASPSRTPRRSP